MKINLVLTKIVLKIAIFLMGFWFFLLSVSAATIESITDGGSWNNRSTWIGGVIPTVNDDVIINGPVFLWSKNITVNNLINNSSLYKYNNQDSYNLNINGDFINNGILGSRPRNNENSLNITVKGDIINNGNIRVLAAINLYGDIYNG